MKNSDILDSWKDISAYLEKDIRTCRRWEAQLGLPVHRIDENSSHSKVFAYKSEIDQWLKEKANHRNNKKKRASFFAAHKFKISFISVFLIIAATIAVLFIFNNANLKSNNNIRRIAVFPFNHTGFEEFDEYIPESLTLELISILNRTGRISAYQALSANTNKSNNSKGDEISEDQSSDYFLTGNIIKINDTVDLEIQLAKTKNEKLEYSGVFRGRVDELFPIQASICQKIIDHFKTQNKELYASFDGVNNSNAFDEYLKANFILNRLKNNNNDPWKLYYKGKYFYGKYARENNELAINLFNEAIKLDKNFVKAYIGLANCYANYINFNWDYDLKWLDSADELIEKAKAISTDYPEYYATLINTLLLKKIAFNADTPINPSELVNEGVQKFPNDFQLNSIAGYFYFMRYGKDGNRADFDKALEYKERSFWLSPSNLDNIVYAEFLMLNREFYKALEICKFIRKHNDSLYAQFRLGEIYYYLGDLEKSSEIFQQFTDSPLEIKIDSLFFLGMIASQEKNRKEAFEIADEIKRLLPQGLMINSNLRIASIYMGLGMKDVGYEYLNRHVNMKIIAEMPFISRDYISIDRNFDNVRGDSEFESIINIKEELDD